MSDDLALTARENRTRLKKARRRRQGAYLHAHVVLSIGGFIMAAPFLWQLVMSLSSNREVTSVPPTFFPEVLRFDNYLEVFEVMPFFDQLQVSVLITVIRVVVQIVLCTMAGYAFARMRFRGKAILFAIVLSILLVPGQIYLLSQYQLIQSFGLLNTVLGIMAPGLFSAFGTFLMRQFFLSIPKEPEEAARLDGANPFQTFWSVMLPLIGPAVVVKAGAAGGWSVTESGVHRGRAVAADVVDTTGAGDSFNAGYLAAVAHGVVEEEARLRWAVVAGTLSTRARAAPSPSPR